MPSPAPEHSIWAKRARALLCVCVLSATLVPTSAAFAASAAIVPAAPSVAARSYVMMDAVTLRVLAEGESRLPLPPASLTKIMTSYVAAVEVAADRIALDDEVPVSVNAWRTGGSRMFVREGTRVSLADLLRGIIIQ
ncbi:MAG: serine hydrolase, partial [Gammaproteobacteria bacterium]|nr:serine hydrolase [Gammaproteobacteria bacterium]